MARPKLHKREETLKRALNFFWKNGFSGGSTRELGQALEMHPGSLYSSFGSKEGLYLEAIDLYAQESKEIFQECMETSDFFSGLSEYLDQLVIDDDEHPCTCFLAKTFSSGLGCDKELVEKAQGLIPSFRGHLAARIVRAQEDGELKPELDAEAFAALLLVQLMGLRSLADSAPERSILQSAARDVVEMLRMAASA